MKLDIENALDALETIFPSQPINWKPGVFGVRAEYRGDHFHGYQAHHENLFQPMRTIHTMIKDLSIVIANSMGSYG